MDDYDVELNRMAGDYTGVWCDCNVETICCLLYRRHVSFGFSHLDVARLFVGSLNKKRFGLSRVSIALIHKLDMRDFLSNTG